MILNICTILDKNYLFKGVAQYLSLKKHTPAFVWWVLCMDSETYKTLSLLKYPNIKLVTLDKIETKGLLKVKKDRTIAEYCWTLKSPFVQYLFTNYPKIKEIFYLDSDIFLFDDGSKLFALTNKFSIGVTPHNFPPAIKGREKDTGLFNAGSVYFKNDSEGKKCLKRWGGQCEEWCFLRLENGKLCDQMYLDEWPKLYKNTIIIKHNGVNLAPWNSSQFTIKRKGDMKVSVDGQPLIFYHFHQFRIKNSNSFDLCTGYSLKDDVKNIIYSDYISSIKESIKLVHCVDPRFRFGFVKVKLEDEIKSWLLKVVGPIYWRFSAWFKTINN